MRVCARALEERVRVGAWVCAWVRARFPIGGGGAVVASYLFSLLPLSLSGASLFSFAYRLLSPLSASLIY